MSVEPGRVEVMLKKSDKISQQHGFIHAGAVTSCADTAAGFAALTLMPPEVGVLSIEFHMNMLEPSQTGK